MDSFEQCVSEILWRLGYWTQTEFKVELTKEEKIEIGRQTSPRWEIDVLAFSGAKKELLVVECKSYLDSGGVHISAFDGTNPKFAKRFKLFNEPKTWNVVRKALIRQLVGSGACPDDVSVKLWLVAGKIASAAKDRLKRHFDENGWTLRGPAWLKEQLTELASGDYENQVSAVVSKLILRGETG